MNISLPYELLSSVYPNKYFFIWAFFIPLTHAQQYMLSIMYHIWAGVDICQCKTYMEGWKCFTYLRMFLIYAVAIYFAMSTNEWNRSKQPCSYISPCGWAFQYSHSPMYIHIITDPEVWFIFRYQIYCLIQVCYCVSDITFKIFILI